jgi:hypothetical protein
LLLTVNVFCKHATALAICRSVASPTKLIMTELQALRALDAKRLRPALAFESVPAARKGERKDAGHQHTQQHAGVMPIALPQIAFPP